jgi:peptide chain release factor 1
MKSIPGFMNEAGGHRIQRIPDTERKGRVHTSTVCVSVLEGERKTLDVRDSDFSVRFYSGTGKGGQRRNKVMSCVTVTHLPSGLTQNVNGRSGSTNEAEAKRLLIERLAAATNTQSASEMNDIRAAQVGSGMRGDKRRTYRFRDDSIEDHITNRMVSARRFMRGDIDLLW